MINIYDSKETNFDNNGLVVLNPISCKVTEELNGIYTLELTHVYDSNNKYQHLVEGNVIKVPTTKGEQLFRIYRKTKGMFNIIVNAQHIFYDLKDNFLEDVRPTEMTGTQALNWILNNTQYQHNFTGFSDIDTIATAYYVRKNPIQALISDDENSFLSRWGGELERDNFNVKILNSIGQDRGYKITYGKNLIGIEEELNITEVATRIMATGVDENNNIVILPEKYIDSPFINAYPNPIVKEIHFSNIKVDSENGITLENVYGQLREEVRKLYEVHKVDIPKANYKVDFIELSKTEEYKNFSIFEQVYLGDTVTIKHSRLGIDIKAKIIKYSWDAVNKKYINLELGNFKQNSASEYKITLNKIENVKLSVDEAKEIGNKIKQALGGYVLKRENELLIMDTPDLGTATKVWRWNINGLGYSTTGYDGDYGLAITMDGEIVADFIKTGTLDAKLLKVGTITSQDGSVSINLSTGAFKIGGNGKVAEHTNEYSRYKHNDGTYTEISSEGLLHVEGTNKKEYHYLLDAYEVTIEGDNTGFQDVIVDIPTKFHGKKYKIITSVSYVSSSKDTIGAFGGYLKSIDYSTNKATFTAYVNSGLGGHTWTLYMTYFIIA